MDWTNILLNEYTVGLAVAGVSWLLGKVMGTKKAKAEVDEAMQWVSQHGSEYLPILEAIASRTPTKVDDEVVALLKKLNGAIGARKLEGLTEEQRDRLRELHKSLG